MRIRVTENQFSKIRAIAGQDDYMSKYKSFCDSKIQEVNNLYTKVQYLTVADIIGNQIKIWEVIKGLNNLEDSVNKAESNMLSLWENDIIGSGDDNFDLVIGDLASSVTDKVTSLTLILNPLESLQELEDEHRLTKSFGDIKVMDVETN